VDGPLAGQTFTWRRLPPTGRPLTVAVVDVEHSVLAVDYRVQAGARGPGCDGDLRFVAARDVRRPRWGLRTLAGR
jgi:hypothetical protein